MVRRSKPLQFLDDDLINFCVRISPDCSSAAGTKVDPPPGGCEGVAGPRSPIAPRPCSGQRGEDLPRGQLCPAWSRSTPQPGVLREARGYVRPKVVARERLADGDPRVAPTFAFDVAAHLR